MKGQNVSTAVMQRREPTPDGVLGPRGFPKSVDYFPTPPWAARAACAFLANELREPLEEQSCWEPACGELHLVRGLVDYFADVRATDILRYDPAHGICDFLQDGPTYAPVDWVFTNPPFRDAAAFIDVALRKARRGVVMFVRSSFTEGADRYETMFRPGPRAPAYVVTYCERVVLLRDRLIQANALDPFNMDEHGNPQRASSATSYSLVVWVKGENDTRHRWIEPCRTAFEAPGDYPAYEEQWAVCRAAQMDADQLALFA